MLKLIKLAAAIIVCESVGIAGSFFTFSAIGDWYLYLNKPFFSPPNWVFGPVWTILYLMMGVAVFLIWQKGLKDNKNRAAVKMFGFQLAANFFWSILFFGLRSPLLGLINIVIMWWLIVLTVRKFYPISKTAALLLIPYLAWVSFAAMLNLSIVILNY